MARSVTSALVVAWSLAGCFVADVDLPEDQSPVVQAAGPFRVDMPTIWPMKALFDGQTAVPTDATFVIRGVHWDLHESEAPVWVALLRLEDGLEVAVEATLETRFSGTFTVSPADGLEADTDYAMAFPGCRFMPHVRWPDPIRFSTRSAPRVLSRWRADGALILVTSEPLDPDTVVLAPGFVDLVRHEGVDGQYGFTSVVSEGGAEEFAILHVGHRTTINPMPTDDFEVLLGPGVQASTGVGLQGVVPVSPAALPVCWRRADYPVPCLTESEAAETIANFDCPFVPDPDVP